MNEIDRPFLTEQEHRDRHIMLHEALNELMADWIADTGGLPSQNSVLALMRWSAKEAGKETDGDGDS